LSSSDVGFAVGRFGEEFNNRVFPKCFSNEVVVVAAAAASATAVVDDLFFFLLFVDVVLDTILGVCACARLFMLFVDLFYEKMPPKKERFLFSFVVVTFVVVGCCSSCCCRRRKKRITLFGCFPTSLVMVVVGVRKDDVIQSQQFNDYKNLRTPMYFLFV
jgi:hypothetical protein